MVSNKPKIAVAMSGGVDSSVSAWLLKKQGYDVSGFFMKFWKDKNCRNDKSLKSAKSAAKRIGIPFHIIDVRKEFKKSVVDDFINEYKNLRTANPCINCNKFIKFGWFLNFAIKKGFDKIATGHYARIKKDKKNIFHLFSGLDISKDQSYFLYQLNQKQLSKIIFPLGDVKKEKVKEIAKREKIFSENKGESQEICFIHDDYREFLKRNLPGKYFFHGNIINKEKKIIGRHSGLPNYTIGQRRGIFRNKEKNENREPLYATGFNKKGNELIVGSRKDICSDGFFLKKVFWISPEAEKKFLESHKIKVHPHIKKFSNLPINEPNYFGVRVKIRYKSALASCIITQERSKLKVVFNHPQEAITPGQSAVFYLGKEVLGGGNIDSSLSLS